MDTSSNSSVDSNGSDEEQGRRNQSLSTQPLSVSPSEAQFIRGKVGRSGSRVTFQSIESQSNDSRHGLNNEEGSDDGISNVMQNFLADFMGILDGDRSISATNGRSQRNGAFSSSAGDNPGECIFESDYDLTDERLRFVFAVFDQDEDGRIDYDSLRRGLQFHSSSADLIASPATLDDETFNQLISYLDLDKSGDISFEEFSEGVRLTILRGLLKRTDTTKELFMAEVLDYNAQRLQRFVMNEDKFDFEHSSSIVSMSANEFYFQYRPSWVRVRWVNIYDVHSRVLEKVGVKHRLHPLAIEDALDPESHRPKADDYSSHYFLMVPLFHLEPLDVNNMKSFQEKKETMYKCCCSRITRLWRGSTETLEDQDLAAEPRMGNIVINTASVFVCLPWDNTVITYIKEGNDIVQSGIRTLSSRPWRRVQEELTKSYSKLRQYSGQYLCYSLLDEAVDMIGPIISKVTKEIRKEKELLKSTQYKDLTYIHELGSQLRRMSRKLKPFVRLLQHVIEDEQILPGPTVFLRDVLDNLENYDEELRHMIRDCANVDSEAEKSQQRQIDSTLYTLTVISAVFVPAQFLTGVWGMNFENMPELDDQYGYLMFWILAITLMTCALVFLKCGRIRV
ncbi:CorA-like Mg2+ transporter [Nitzschia inconspicua]|uniref:CorA-like Mg2+ transporter n=1 Tax=Nitzschia inconspicua TaxID=303405 RepID=A0A9K3KQG6_9STRA|nr:CorA-like Mg2+ transporter [Nitzschia inconspicua]